MILIWRTHFYIKLKNNYWNMHVIANYGFWKINLNLDMYINSAEILMGNIIA